MKTKKTTKKSKKLEDKIEIVLEGSVFLVETKNGKKTKTLLDGELVLKSVVSVLQKSLTYAG